MGWVWEHSRSKSTDRLVLLAIADCASDDGGNAYPSIATLMRKTGLSERAVHNALSRLAGQDCGELKIHRNAGPKGCNRYRVIMTPAVDAPPQNMHPAADAPPALDAPLPPQQMHPTPAADAPRTVLEPSVEPSEVKSISSDAAHRPDVEKVCEHLADRIQGNGSKRPTITKRWRDTARLLIDKDGRTVDQIIRAIDWCQDDDFWRGVVLSMPKLRDKYDQLRLAASRPQTRASPARDGRTLSTSDQIAKWNPQP